jgi:hypothetical protein
VTGLAGVLIVVALRETARRRDGLALSVAATLIGFIVFLVRVGRDEMILSRLYLPALPLAMAYAALGLRSLAPPTARVLSGAVLLVAGTITLGALPAARFLELGDRSYVPLAEEMMRRAPPGALVVFQDLGRTPYTAMSLRFVDPIGLVDAQVAATLHADHANPFIRGPSVAAQQRIRDHLFSLAPRQFAFVAYVDRPYQREVAERFDHGEREALLRPFAVRNSYQVGLFDDPRFDERFRFVEAWRRHDGYYLLLYDTSDP